MSKELEFREVTGKELVEKLEALVKQMSDPEKKYQLQVELKDVEFEADEARAEALGIEFPVGSIGEAERCLREQVIMPVRFAEQFDETVHQVAAFDPTPVGYSGFMGCVTHSLALTDQGLFEIGRYPAVSLTEPSKVWQWFLHRRLMTAKEVEELGKAGRSPQEILELVYEGVTGKSR